MAAILFTGCATSASYPARLEYTTLDSRAMKRPMRYAVYTPENFEPAERAKTPMNTSISTASATGSTSSRAATTG